MSHPLDDAILAAAARILTEKGWAALTLEAVAEQSGVSRATLYRRGTTRELIAAALAERAAAGWKDAIWPALTAAGSAAERLELALRASCAAIELHPGVLSAPPNPVVDATATPPIASTLGDVFVDPFERLLADGAADGSLDPGAHRRATATLIFSAVSRGYVAARGVVSAQDAADTVVRAILRGVSAG